MQPVIRVENPLRFTPLIKRALWGGTRLRDDLGKSTGNLTDAAESWEVCDLPGNASVVAEGPLAGKTLRELMEHARADLLGRHQHFQQFPLLIKFLDAREQLSVQVHPKDPVLMLDGSVRMGKTESWIVVDAEETNRMYVGLRPGINEHRLQEAVVTGDFGDCLHSYQAQVGDCLHLEPGTVHALGGGLLIAEIQQPSDVTYRLYDWDRVDSEGKPRQLHIEQGMAATNFERGAVLPQIPRPWSERRTSEVLVESPHYLIHRHRGPDMWKLPDDQKLHIFIVLQGTVEQPGTMIRRGETVVLPAARGESAWTLSSDAILIDATLPDPIS